MSRTSPSSPHRAANVLGRAAEWYFASFPIQRGKGLVNRLLGKVLVVTVFDGIRLRLTSPLEFNQRCLLSGGESYEPDVTRALARAVLPGMVVADVGANLGLYTLLASKKVGVDGEVHSFEPSPDQFRHLTLNLRLNRASNVRANNLALADSAGRRTLFLSTGWNEGTHSLARRLDSAIPCSVACTTLDDYVRERRLTRLDVMKADVEGAEFLVLLGAHRTLEALRPGLIIVETDEEYCRSLGKSGRDIKGRLQAHGYQLYRLLPHGRPVATTADVTEEHANLAAVHVDAPDHYRAALFG